MHENGAQFESLIAHAARGIRELARAVEAVRLLPPGHPAIHAAAAQSAGALGAAAAERGSIRLALAPEGITCDDQALTDREAADRLADLLDALDLMALDLQAGATAEQIQALSSALAQARGSGARGAPVAEQIAEGTGGRIRALPMDYGAVRLAEGAGSGERPTGWRELVRAAIACLPLTSGAPLALAADVNEALASATDEDLATLRTELTQSVGCTRRLKAGEAEPMLHRLRLFVASLSPRLRQALRRIDPADPEESIAILVELADILPTGEVLEALGEVNRTRQRLTTNALRLFTKMARVATQHPEHRARVAEILRRWRVESGPDEAARQALEASLEEIFQARSPTEFAPSDYQAHLNSLATRVTASAVELGPGRGIECSRLRSHAAAVAVLVASDLPDPRAEARGLFEYLASEGEALLREGRADLLAGAVRAAAQRLALPESGEADRRAARGLVSAVAAPGVLGRALESAMSDEGASGHALTLVHALGDEALPAVLRVLAGGPPERMRAPLAEFVACRSSDALTRALHELARGPGDLAQAILPVLSSLPAGLALLALGSVTTSEAPGARREAFRAAAALGVAWPAVLLRRGLADADAEVRGLTMERLANQNDLESRRVLTEAATAIGFGPATEFSDRAAALLAAQGESGRVVLAEALIRLSSSVDPGRACAARRLARVLRPRRRERDVRLAWRHWRLSTARLVSFLAGKVP